MQTSFSTSKKYERVDFFRSGWRIRKVSSWNACQIKMYHQEDAGLNAEMAKLAFARSLRSSLCKMDNALCKYNAIIHPQKGCPAVSAGSLIQKVPPGLETMNIDVDASATPEVTTMDRIVTDETNSGDFVEVPRGKS